MALVGTPYRSGGTVRLDSLDGAWWREHFVFGKRVL
jgi:hypothetical protein